VRKFFIATVTAVATGAVFLAASFPKQDPVRQRQGTVYADYLVAYIGKAFDLQDNRAVAVEGATGEFKLTMVGQDFVWLESATDRVCIPLAVLRVVLRK
jgi:hypothetical protein